MATEMPPLVQESLQCPVCFKAFTPGTINTHLDACLLDGSTSSSPPAAADSGSSPPGKKPRISAEPVNRSSSSGTQSSMFPLFQSNKGKLGVQNDRVGVSTSKQSPVRAVNDEMKLTETEFGSAGVEALQNQKPAPVPDTETLKKTGYGLSPRTLLSFDKPLAEVLRPNTLEEYFGQSKVVGQQTLIRSLLESQEIPSLILWGPPGCGKVCR